MAQTMLGRLASAPTLGWLERLHSKEGGVQTVPCAGRRSCNSHLLPGLIPFSSG